MSMTTNALQAAIDLAQARRDAAADSLAKRRQAWLAGQAQLEQLTAYAHESSMRWSTRTGSRTPELMRHHYQFMERLNQAIALQTGIVADHERSVAREIAALREAEARLESLRQVFVSRRREALRAAALREQKLVDERAALRRAPRPTDTVIAELQ